MLDTEYGVILNELIQWRDIQYMIVTVIKFQITLTIQLNKLHMISLLEISKFGEFASSIAEENLVMKPYMIKLNPIDM